VWRRDNISPSARCALLEPPVRCAKRLARSPHLLGSRCMPGFSRVSGKPWARTMPRQHLRQDAPCRYRRRSPTPRKLLGQSYNKNSQAAQVAALARCCAASVARNFNAFLTARQRDPPPADRCKPQRGRCVRSGFALPCCIVAGAALRSLSSVASLSEKRTAPTRQA